MFGAGLLNLGSLIFGLIAWILPIVSLMKYNKVAHGRWIVHSVASVCACAISLCMQILYTNHLVRIGDWSALLDTSRAVAFSAILLLVVTIILNVITMVVYYRKG